MTGMAKVGRPRDESIDREAVAATLELLAESGFDATSMQAIATRAGLHASALYRRWSSRIELIEDAVTPTLTITAASPTGDLAADLARFIGAYLHAWDSPAARAAIPALLTHYQSSGSDRRPEQWLPVSVRPQFMDILLAAPEGSVDRSVDPDDVFDVLLGAILARVLVPTVVERTRPVEALVDLTMRMLAPTTTPTTSTGPRPRSSRPTRSTKGTRR